MNKISVPHLPEQCCFYLQELCKRELILYPGKWFTIHLSSLRQNSLQWHSTCMKKFQFIMPTKDLFISFNCCRRISMSTHNSDDDYLEVIDTSTTNPEPGLSTYISCKPISDNSNSTTKRKYNRNMKTDETNFSVVTILINLRTNPYTSFCQYRLGLYYYT